MTAPGEPAPASIETVVTCLEMTSPPARAAAKAPRTGLEVRRALRPTLSFYRYLYHAVGGPWTWTARALLSDRELRGILCDPAVEVNVLWVEGVPAGYAELDWRRPPDAELAYFGLVPEFIGQGLGRYLLDWTIAHAWRRRPRRLRVDTCELDHPRALAVYRSSGFRVYERRIEQVALPAGVPSPGWPRGREPSPCASC